MDYKSLMGYGKKKKKIVKEQLKSKKKTVLDSVKQELNEWNHQPPSEKRWSKSFGGSGLTEFEERGGKDNVKLNEKMNNIQANLLLKQLGGNKFKAMTGAKDFGIGSDGLQFKIGRNSKSISHIVIRLTSMDVYEMKFLRVRAGKITVVKKVNNVYADKLGVIFKKYTGMNVRL